MTHRFSPRFFRPLLLILMVVGTNAAQTKENQAAYPFRTTPSEVIQLLRERGLVEPDAISEVELKLLVDAGDGKLDHFSFDDAVLIASGVTNAAARKRYLARLDRIQVEAQKALAGVDTKLKQGDRLLKFLHDQPMANGYACTQTDPHTILDIGEFNCVSSAALFNVLAARLEHDVRAVEIPGHVFSTFYDGTKWVDVETTNKLGFNPSRHPAERERFKKPNGLVYIPERHAHLRREVHELGLAAIIYYNHGVALANGKQYRDSVIASFIAVGLDRANTSAAKNALAHLNNWALALNDENEFERALKVVSVGLIAVPDDSSLQNNRKVIWLDYAKSAMKAGGEDEAIAVLRRATADVPEGDFVLRQACLFEDQAKPLIGAGRLEEAIAIVERGISKVDEQARERLREWRAGHVHNHVLKEMRTDLRAGRYDAALSVIARHAKWLRDDTAACSFQREVYDTWAGKLAEEHKWREVSEVYTAALRSLPGDKHLSHNAVVNFDHWARSHIKAENWKSAIQVYEQGLQQFPNCSLLKNNLNYCKHQS